MVKDKKDKNKEPGKIAPGMDYKLNRKATEEEKRREDTTRVTTLSWDEVDNK